MQRNTVTSLDKLKIGDTYHKLPDTKKTVMQVLSIQNGAFQKVVSVTVLERGKADKYSIVVKTPEKKTVVFLRHNAD